MDHLPYPDLNVPPLVVPYLADFEYDHGDFATFPERAGFWKDGALDLDRPCKQLAALAQAWLFFGLIDVFAGQGVDKGVFIRRGDGCGADEGVIDTTKLGHIVVDSVKCLRKRSFRSKALKEMRVRLMEAARASSTLDQVRANDPPSAAVFLSIKVLIIYLSEIFDTAFWLDLGRNVPPIPLQDSFRSGILGRGRLAAEVPVPARLLMDRMRQSGWCVHQIMEVCRGHNYCVVYYYSSIARAESWADITHEACTEAQCIAYNIRDDSAYRMRHIEECPGCELVGPPEDEVAEIVRGGGIPLVELNPASLRDQPGLRVTPATPHTRYTAISHVWIDGRGNPTANTLPTCQLQNLAAQLSAISNAQQSWTTRLWKRPAGDTLSASHLLWMDTLCIPPRRDSEDQKFLRKKAIHRMALIYVGAAEVLVLDAELDKLRHDDNQRELTDALISCSRWNGRCWTLEEGALARKCLFQFKDAAKEATPHQDSIPTLVVRALKSPWRAARAGLRFSIDELLLRRPDYEWPPRKISGAFARDHLRRELSTAALRSAQTDFGLAAHAGEREVPGRDLQVDKFARTWNDVGRRSTTRPEDIHPIVANLTDFSTAQIMGLETPVLRTKMILHCLGRFPLDVLWTPCARPQAGADTADRWVPSVPGPEPLVERVKLRSTGKGLVVDTENYWKPPEVFWIPLGTVAPRFCFRHSQDVDRNELWCVVECIVAEDDALPRTASQTACLMLSPTAASERASTAAPRVLRGARLLVTKGKPGTSKSLYLRYDCPLTCIVRKHQPDAEELPATPVLTVEAVPPSQKLVIESKIDPKEHEKFAMRSRDFYHGASMIAVDRILIAMSGGVSMLTVILSVLLTCCGNVWEIPDEAMGPLTLLLTAVAACIGVAAIQPVIRWKHARAYNAWKATFEEDWRPRGFFVRRFVKGLRLPRGRMESKKNRDHVNV